MATPITGTYNIHANTVYGDVDADDAVFNIYAGALFFIGDDVLAQTSIAQTGKALNVGTISLDGLSVEDDASFVNDGTVLQAGANVTLGASVEDAATLKNLAGATWDITDDSGVADGGGQSRFGNWGDLEKTGGTGTSEIAASFFDAGEIFVDDGLIDFAGPSTVVEGEMTGSGTVEFSGGRAFLEGSATQSPIAIEEMGSTVLWVDASLTLPGAFTQQAGTALNIAAGDSLKLQGAVSLSGTVGGAGALDLAGPAATFDGTHLWVAKVSGNDAIIEGSVVSTGQMNFNNVGIVVLGQLIIGGDDNLGMITQSNALRPDHYYESYIDTTSSANVVADIGSDYVNLDNKGKWMGSEFDDAVTNDGTLTMDPSHTTAEVVALSGNGNTVLYDNQTVSFHTIRGQSLDIGDAGAAADSGATLNITDFYSNFAIEGFDRFSANDKVIFQGSDPVSFTASSDGVNVTSRSNVVDFVGAFNLAGFSASIASTAAGTSFTTITYHAPSD